MATQTYNSGSSETTDLFSAEPVVYGSFGDRFGAVLLDGLILIIPNYVLATLFGQEPGVLMGLVIRWLYDALQESGVNQATIGKKAVGLKVVSMEGQRISFGQATARHFGKYISAIILLIGYFMMLWDDKKQTLHDKMANTLVIKRYS